MFDFDLRTYQTALEMAEVYNAEMTMLPPARLQMESDTISKHIY